MKRKNKFLILILVTIAIISALVANTPLNKQTIPTRFIAGENMGFDLGPGNLNFGKIIPGQSASRNITITNTYTHQTLTTIKSSGEISEHIIISENNFILQPNESKEIMFSCYPEKGIDLIEYQGKIIIITKKD